MKLRTTTFWTLIICVFCLSQQAKGQTPCYQLIAVSSYVVYIDSVGNEFLFPVDSIHYGYVTNKQSDIEAVCGHDYSEPICPRLLPYFDTEDIRTQHFDTLVQFSADSSIWLENKKIINWFDSTENLVKKVMQKGTSVVTTIDKYEGKLLEESHTDGDKEQEDYYYSYNENGKLIKETFKVKDSPEIEETTQYQYDDKDREIYYSHYYSYSTDSGTAWRDTLYTNYVDSGEYKIVYTSGRRIQDDVDRHIHSRELFKYDGQDLVAYQKEVALGDSNDWHISQYDTIVYENHKIIKYLTKIHDLLKREVKKSYWFYNEKGLPVRWRSRYPYSPSNEWILHFEKNIKPYHERQERRYYYRSCAALNK